MVELHECFDILPNRRAIRLKGTRIDWEHVVQLFQNGLTPDAIATHFSHSLSLELVYAAITYYLLNKNEYEEYLRHGDIVAKQEFDIFLSTLPSEQRDNIGNMTVRLHDLKTLYTDAHGRLDIKALKEYLAKQNIQTSGAGV